MSSTEYVAKIVMTGNTTYKSVKKWEVTVGTPRTVELDWRSKEGQREVKARNLGIVSFVGTKEQVEAYAKGFIQRYFGRYWI